MDKLKDNLYVSNETLARKKGDKFDRVISLSSENENTTHKFLIDDGEHEYSKFKDAVNCALEGLENGEEVLVHCRAGISRSVSVCIAIYVVTEDEANYDDAYNIVQRGFQHPSPQLLDSAKKYIENNTSESFSHS